MIATERLRLRELDLDDVERLVALDADPEVTAYLTGGVPSPRPAVLRQVVADIQTYARHHGLGRWAAELDGAFVGWFALMPHETGESELELGYRLQRSCWGRGLATEGSRALLGYAFGRPQVSRVWAQTMAVNRRSRAVLERCGLHHVRTFFPHFDDPIPGTEQGEVEYALTRSEWVARPGVRGRPEVS